MYSDELSKSIVRSRESFGPRRLWCGTDGSMWLPAAGTLAACADDGGSEDEPAARAPLALRELLGPLARLLARLEGALQAVRSVPGRGEPVCVAAAC